MERWIPWVYLFFAVVHPISELIRKTNLRSFLNEDYYQTNREDFPVPINRGKMGSATVLVILILPALWRSDAVWCFALGLAVADVIQHFFHLVLRPGEVAPRVHLLTIIGVLYFLWRIAPDPRPDFFAIENLGALIAGGLIIFVNWWWNSWQARHHVPASASI